MREHRTRDVVHDSEIVQATDRRTDLIVKKSCKESRQNNLSCHALGDRW